MADRLHPLKTALGVILAVAACWLAYRAWDDARFAYLRASDIAAAHAARPADASSLSKFLDRRMQRDADFLASEAELKTVRTALADAPLSRGLLRILGLEAEKGGNPVKSDAAFALSDSVSRRDALTQLWLIERSVNKDDMNAAIRHYHAALSVHPELGPALYPILAKAIAFPEVRAALTPYLARQARWSEGLLNWAIAQSNPADVAALVTPVGDMVRGGPYEGINARLLTRLAQAGDFSAAGELAQAVIPNSHSATLRAFAVNDATTDKRLGALAWTLVEEGRILASANDLGGFDVDIEPLGRGLVASRMVPVTGGKTYILGQTMRGGGAAEAAVSLNWQAFCLPSRERTPIWQQMLPKPRSTARYQSSIAVPPACKGLEFVLAARGPEGQESAHIAFESLDLKPSQN